MVTTTPAVQQVTNSPNDPSQWADADGDGWGDNPNGNNPDHFLKMEHSGLMQMATDGDNPNGNNADVWPNDLTQCLDSDGDGIWVTMPRERTRCIPNRPHTVERS